MCIYNTKLEEIFSKKYMHTSHVKHDKPSHAKTPHVHHANTSHVNHAKTPHVHKSHVHKPHAHYAFKYGRIYKCTYCGQNGHLAKFLYNHINSTNNHVWVRNTNTLGPKKIWVPKSIIQLFDIGTHQDVESGGTLIVVA